MESACRIFEGEEALTVIARVGDALGGLGGCGGGRGCLPSRVRSRRELANMDCSHKTSICTRASRAKKVVIEEEYTFNDLRKKGSSERHELNMTRTDNGVCDLGAENERITFLRATRRL